MEIKGIKYTGPLYDSSGYARAARGNVLALYNAGVPITINPISFESIHPDLGEEGRILNSLTNKDIDYNVNIIHSTPEFWEQFKEDSVENVGYTIWETTKLHPDWEGYINNNVTKVLVGCEWNKEVFKNSGINIPIGVVPHGIDLNRFNKVEPYSISNISEDDYVFYSIFQWCYDEETRVLTKEGFKYFKELSYEDEIATLNKETEELEYHNPEKIVKFRRKDKMLKLKGSQFDVCVTPDHKMVVKEHAKNSYSTDPEKSWNLVPFNELLSKNKEGETIVSSKYRTKKNCNWFGKKEEYFEIPYSNNGNFINGGDGLKLKIEPFMKFLGWYISEGSLEESYNYYRVAISQVKSNEHIKEIWECIEDLGFTPINHGHSILFNSREMYLYLKYLGKCYEKFIPKEIKEFCKEHLLVMLDSLFKGDGSYHRNGNWCRYTTTSKKLAEDVQECLIKVGYSGAISIADPTKKKPGTIEGREIIGKRLQYNVSVNRENNEPSMYYADLEEVDYDGYVYCATVTNHTMLVERNGKILFSGNTERKHPTALIKAYYSAFTGVDDVALVLKTHRSDYSDREKEAIRTTIRRIKTIMPLDHYPKISYISDMLSEEEIAALHTRGDCYVSLDRGEGFGLSPFEAGAAGNPIIVTGFGGATEYAKPHNSYLVDYNLTPVFGMPWSPWYTGQQMWAEPNVEDGINKMKYAYNNRKEAEKKGLTLQQDIVNNFSWEMIANKIIEELKGL